MRINQFPRFTMAMAQSQAFLEDPVVIMDVGAAGGFQKYWSVFGDKARFIGFEPNEEECQRLNALAAKNQRYYPVALSKTNEKRNYLLMSWPESSSFYPADMNVISRFPDEVNVIVRQEIEIQTVDFDTFAEEQNITSVDFMKLDCEGSELDVLKGAEKFLKSTVIGVHVEALFQRWRIGQPVFNEIDQYLRELGFQLYDLDFFRHARKALPPLVPDVGGLADYGQVIWGNFVYFKDAVQEIQDGHIDHWKVARLLKLACFLEIYSLQDCAIELMKVIGTGYSVLDLLMPMVNGRYVSYSDYMSELGRLGKSTR